MEWIQEMEESDGLDDAGTLVFGSEKEQKPQRVYPAAKIKIDRVQFSIFELKRRFDKKMICLDPDFQRNYVWKPRQKSDSKKNI